MNFWHRLNRRERLVVSCGGTLLIAVIVYLLLISPFRKKLAEMRESIPQKSADLTWMQNGAIYAAELQKTSRSADGTSPLKLIDVNARQYGIADKLKRITPGDNDQIKVWFEDLVFVDLIRFLRELDREHNIEVIAFTAERLDGPGLVNARITFQAPQQ